MDTFRLILASHGGNKRAAAEQVARGLMAGDPASFKAGYTADNAVIAAARVYEPLLHDEVVEVAEAVGANPDVVVGICQNDGLL